MSSQFFTTAQTARQLGVSASLVRRLCQRHRIGEQITPRLRLLTAADIERVRAARGPRGRPRTRDESED